MATPPPSLAYRRFSRSNNELLPMDLMIQIFMHLCRDPQDLVNCALTTKHWAGPALQELYRHPWAFLFSYQYDTEGRVMDKHGSILLLRTLLQGCMDPSKAAFPYASFARSVNLKWIHDTFDLPELDIQALTGFRWTRNETPKDFLIRHLLDNRPYLNDFIHCHTPRLPRCLFGHMATAAVNDLVDPTIINDANAANAANAIATHDVIVTEGSAAAGETVTDNPNPTNPDHIEEFVPEIDMSLLETPPLLPVQQPIATAMPLVHTATASVSDPELSQLGQDHHNVSTSYHQVVNTDSVAQTALVEQHSPPSPMTLVLAQHGIEVQPTVEAGMAIESMEQYAAPLGANVAETHETAEGTPEGAVGTEIQNEMAGILESTLIEPSPQASGQVVTQSLTAVLATASSSTAPPAPTETPPVYAFQQPYISPLTQPHSRTTTSSSILPSSRLFLATWPLTMGQTRSLVFLDLRYAIISDALITSLALNCRRIESLKVATHWQHYPHSYSVTDHALACLVAAQHALKLVHIENHREISQGHELIRTINTLARLHGSTLETLVLKSHDFQNCNLAGLGEACRKLVKFATPGGVHLSRDAVVKLTEACKLTLEHLDFSNSDIETECLMSILKGTSTPDAARGVLKTLILLGMEDTLNQETCLAIGEHGSGLDCFRLDILESEARDICQMLRRPCAVNLRVLTLGCHDVHGDLANGILEQIALNCRNVELLDVNHWQFSAKAIENVLRECGMLKYLNVSYTDIAEGTAEIICKCLGGTKLDVNEPTMPSSEVSAPTPLPVITSSTPQLQTPSTLQEGREDEDGEVVMDEVGAALIQQQEMESRAVITPDQEPEDEVVENVEEERPDVSKKRGFEAKLKDEGDENDGQFMDTNMDSEDQHIAPMYSTNSTGKKQSQIGLVHHYSNAMDLRTIMNLDLDEVTETDLSMTMDDIEMDLDMCLDLKRYYRDVFCKDSEDARGGEEQERDVEMMDYQSVDDEEISRPREPKGKEVYIDRSDVPCHQNGMTSGSFTSIMAAYSSSYGSTSSSSSASSSSSLSSSSSSTLGLLARDVIQAQGSEASPFVNVAGTSDSPTIAPLLLSLATSSQETTTETDSPTGSTSASPSVNENQGVPPMTSECTQDAEQLTALEPSSSNTCAVLASLDSHSDFAVASIPTISASPLSQPLLPSSSNSGLDTAPETVAMTADTEMVDDSWTKESRLEQVNIECCSHLSPATMSRIKELALERQTELMRQGRTKSRIWVENEHDMMMTRLAMERGPELPAERLRTSIITTAPDSSTAGGSSSSSNIISENGSDLEAGALSNDNHQPILDQPPHGPQQEHPQEHQQQDQPPPESDLQQPPQEDESMMSLIEAEAMS